MLLVPLAVVRCGDVGAPQEYTCPTTVTSDVTDTLGSCYHGWEVSGWEQGIGAQGLWGFLLQLFPGLLPGAVVLQVPVSGSHGFFLGLLWRSPARGDIFPQHEMDIVVLKGDGATSELLCAGNAARAHGVSWATEDNHCI